MAFKSMDTARREHAARLDAAEPFRAETRGQAIELYRSLRVRTGQPLGPRMDRAEKTELLLKETPDDVALRAGHAAYNYATDLHARFLEASFAGALDEIFGAETAA